MTEQRYRALLEVLAGVRLTEVAVRYGVSRQSVHAWLVRHRQEGIAGLEDRSHRVDNHPWRISAQAAELICELRRGHLTWGPGRLVFEMGRRGHQMTRSTAYRRLVRNGLVEPKARRRRRSGYRRWERGTAMELWQLDVTASVFLASGTEVKIVTGIDGHSRLCVLPKAVMPGPCPPLPAPARPCPHRLARLKAGAYSGSRNRAAAGSHLTAHGGGPGSTQTCIRQVGQNAQKGHHDGKRTGGT